MNAQFSLLSPSVSSRRLRDRSYVSWKLSFAFSSLAALNSSYPTARRALFLKPQIVIHRHGNLLVRPKIALCRLYGRVPEQKLDLFQVPAALAAQLGTSAPLMPHAALAPLCRIPDHAESKPQTPRILGDTGSQG